MYHRRRRDGLPRRNASRTQQRDSIAQQRDSIAQQRDGSAQQRAREARARRTRIIATRRSRSNQSSSPALDAVRSHFSALRSAGQNDPVPNSTSPALGVSTFNTMSVVPETSVFNQTVLMHEDNIECNHCGAYRFKEEKTNCCKKGEYAIHGLHDIPPSLYELFRSPEFSRNQRKYNSLFSFTALAAGGMQKSTWTQPSPPSMLTLHGKAYHRIFDLEEQYQTMTVNNSSRLYIYDSDFMNTSNSLNVNRQTSSAVRNYVQNNIPWAQQYRAAVDEVIRSNDVTSGPAFIEFAEVSRVNDGPVIGQPVAAPEIAAILYESGQQCASTQPIITYPKNSPDNKPRFLPLWSSAIEPLQFPLLFCKGESGWSKGHASETPSLMSRTMNKYNTTHVPFLFYCRQRLMCEPVFKLNSRIAQEWSCSMYSRFEENTLTYAETGGMQRRLASYRTVRESSDGQTPGKLLPATFHGSPMKRKRDTEDALAVVNRRGRPHLMITVTCNPLWPEIVDNLEPHQTATDRPDLAVRVFKVKLAQIMAELKSGRVFSDYDFHLFCVEFQKRGLPHAHICIKMRGNGPSTPDLIDSWVWAQLPSEDIAGGSLREKVLKYMIHRPCGGNNPNSPCMETNRSSNAKRCNKHYPQPWRNTASINDKTGRAEYKRIDNGDRPKIRQKVNGVWTDVEISNQWVVPYNPYLLMMFDCHICVDIVTASSCVKYLFKYVHKGADMARARISGVSSEIEQYRKTRYVSAAEATWRIMGYDLLNRTPAVTLVHAHLEGEQNILYPDGASQEERQQIAEAAVSDLMRYFNRPAPTAFTQLTMLDYFEQYIIKKKKKDDEVPTAAPPGKWLDGYGNIVSERTTPHVCRIAFQSPAIGDLFYLRLMLHKTHARSFQQLRTVRSPQDEETEHDNFQNAARAMRLVTGDEEYFICMEEASIFKVGSQLRGLFVTLLLDGGPAMKLWEEYDENLIEDLLQKYNREEAIEEALRQIDYKLQLHGKSNEQLGLPRARHKRTEYERMKFSFDRDKEKTICRYT